MGRQVSYRIPCCAVPLKTSKQIEFRVSTMGWTWELKVGTISASDQEYPFSDLRYTEMGGVQELPAHLIARAYLPIDVSDAVEKVSQTLVFSLVD